MTTLLLLALAALPIRPDHRLTPGVTVPVTVAAICTPGYSATVRHVSQATKVAVFQAYGIPPSGRFEIDHLISLELGGSNVAANLWPQSYHTTPNAHMKDALENRLHWLVCHQALGLDEAQRAISEDWIQAYDKFITHGPPKRKKALHIIQGTSKAFTATFQSALHVNIASGIVFASRDQLLLALAGVPAGALLNIGYVGDDGQFHPLSQSDLQFDEHGFLKVSDRCR